jgi:putative spermidine/putrescine transport system ATP-binding protein
MARLSVVGLTKSYGPVAAVSDLSHEFADGEITTVVGPSGSGKTTTLWMIAGLIDPDAGRVFVDGADLTAVPAEKREIGMVFQSYALFPHLTVEDNVAFGLRVRGVGRAERKGRAREALARVRLEGLTRRSVTTLSGGEQQRVALARALVYQPGVLLLDEPLSALDARLRESLRGELFSLLRELAITTVYVTHDRVEAMSLGTHVLVMNCGRIEQAGSPRDVYTRPMNAFVAEFLGGANLFRAECVAEDGGIRLRLPFAELELDARTAAVGPCWAMLRPEDVQLASNGDADFEANLRSAFFQGSHLRLQLEVSGHPMVVDVRDPGELHFTDGVPLRVRRDKIWVWPREAEDERQMPGRSTP